MKNPLANYKYLILYILIIGGIGVQTSCVGDIDFPPAMPTDFGYCIFDDDETCSYGSTKVCPAGGRLSNECPYGSSSGNGNYLSSSSDNSSSSSSNGSSSSSSGIELRCDGFIDGTEREHYGKSKPQFCDERDGQKYVYVTIGTQTWMAQNLNYNASGSVCYNNQESNCATYGRLYNWNTALTVCPEGWHLPTNNEFAFSVYVSDKLNALAGYIESDKGCRCDARHLKSVSGWNSNGGGLDSYGFAALPGGNGSSDGNFFSVGKNGSWWSATEDYEAEASQNRTMDYYREYAYWNNFNRSSLFSVRCIRD